MTSSNRLRRALALGLAAALVVALSAISAATAKAPAVKPAPSTAYASPIAAKRGFAVVYTDDKRKINSFSLRAKFKDSAGKICREESYTLPSGLTQIDFALAKPAKVNRKGKYSFAAKQESAPFAGAKANVHGKFKNASRTSIVVKASWNGCKTGKVTFKKAVPTQG